MKNFIIGFQFILIGALGSLSGLQLYEYKELAEDYAKYVWVQTGVWDQQDEVKTQQYRITNYFLEQNQEIPPQVANDWSVALLEAADAHNVSPALILSVIHVESRTVQYTERGATLVSSAGAKGVMQVMDFWANECPYANKPADLRHGTINLKCGVYVLGRYLDENGRNVEHALVAYNSGPVGVRLYKRGRDVTGGYAKRVMSRI